MSKPETICYDCRRNKHLWLGLDCCVDCYYIRREHERQAAELHRQERELVIERSRDIGGLSR